MSRSDRYQAAGRWLAGLLLFQTVVWLCFLAVEGWTVLGYTLIVAMALVSFLGAVVLRVLSVGHFTVLSDMEQETADNPLGPETAATDGTV